MTFITFEPNQPQSFIFSSEGPYTLPNGAGCLYPLPDGAWLHLTASVAESEEQAKKWGFHFENTTEQLVPVNLPGKEQGARGTGARE